MGTAITAEVALGLAGDQTAANIPKSVPKKLPRGNGYGLPGAYGAANQFQHKRRHNSFSYTTNWNTRQRWLHV